MSKLPQGWVEVVLEDIVEILDSQRVPLNSDERHARVAGKKESELIPYYGATGQVGFTNSHIFDEDLVLLGEDGVPFFDLYKHKAYRISGKSWVNNHAHVLRAKKRMMTCAFLEHYLNAFDYTGTVTGSTRLKLTQGAMRTIKVPLPPLTEQKRIADKLDAVLARVESTRARLDRIPALLKRFRQAVLAAATGGALTEEWRGNAVTEWERVLLKDVCRSIADGDHQAPPQVKIGIPFITISAINEGFVDLSKSTRFVPKSYFDNLKEERKPEKDSILYSVAGSICIPAIVNEENFVFQRHIAILKAKREKILPKFLYLWLGSNATKKQGIGVATGTAQLTVPLNGLRNFILLLPTLEEQHEIVRRVESLFAIADRIQKQYEAAKAKIDRLAPALLAKAFRGERVPQDPRDEPASVMLERLRASKDATQSL